MRRGTGPEGRATTDRGGRVKRLQRSRTEPQQGSGVSSPVQERGLAREIGKTDGQLRENHWL